MKKRFLAGLCLTLVLLTAAMCSVVTTSAAPTNLVNNGDFETGDFSNWTVFQTANGVINESVVMYDTTGSGASYAARFNVGQVNHIPSVFEGGGIYQEFNAEAGAWEVSAVAIAACDPGGGANYEGGLFELIIDGTVVDSHQFGYSPVGQILRATLAANGNFAASGLHEIRIKITRPWTSDLSAAPYQYVDNINLVMDVEPGPGPQPEPEVGGDIYPLNKSTLLLPVAGLAVAILVGTGVYLRYRRAQN